MGRGVYYLDVDPAACEWTRELMKAGLIPEGDIDTRSIADVSADDIRGYSAWHLFNGISGWAYSLRLAGWPDDRTVLSGSCPCQSFSTAGKRRGKDDERHLWPAMYRLVRDLRPPVVVGEQVVNAVRFGWLDEVKADCEAEGYEFATADLPVAAAGGPHIRARLWWVAALPGAGRPGSPPYARPARPRVHAHVAGAGHARGLVVPGAGGGEAEGDIAAGGLADPEVAGGRADAGAVRGGEAEGLRGPQGQDERRPSVGSGRAGDRGSVASRGTHAGTTDRVADAERERAGRGAADQERPADPQPGRAGELPRPTGPGGGPGADGLADPADARLLRGEDAGADRGVEGGGEAPRRRRAAGVRQPARGGAPGRADGGLAHADDGGRGRGSPEQPGQGDGATGGRAVEPGRRLPPRGVADADGGHAGPERQPPGGEHGQQSPDGRAPDGLADAHRGGRPHPGAELDAGGRRGPDGDGEHGADRGVADPDGAERRPDGGGDADRGRAGGQAAVGAPRSGGAVDPDGRVADAGRELVRDAGHGPPGAAAEGVRGADGQRQRVRADAGAGGGVERGTAGRVGDPDRVGEGAAGGVPGGAGAERPGGVGAGAGGVAHADGGERRERPRPDLGADETAPVGEVRVHDAGGRGGPGRPAGGLGDPGGAGLQERAGDRGVQPSPLVAPAGQAPVGPGDADGPGGLGHADVRGRGQADDPEQGGPAAADARGFWADAALIRCRDGKVRRIPSESGVQPLAPGLPADLDALWDACRDRFPLTKRKIEGRVALLKGSGNAIAPELAAEFLLAVREALGDFDAGAAP